MTWGAWKWLMGVSVAVRCAVRVGVSGCKYHGKYFVCSVVLKCDGDQAETPALTELSADYLEGNNRNFLSGKGQFLSI